MQLQQEWRMDWLWRQLSIGVNGNGIREIEEIHSKSAQNET
jgi:hypothetical protein